MGFWGWAQDILESHLSELHGFLTEVHAAMETLAAQCCLMLLEDFKEPVLGYFNPYRAT